MLRKTTLIGILLICLCMFGCAETTSRVVSLQSPKTHKTVECKVDPSSSVDATKQIDDCVSKYKKAGYVVIRDSKK